MPSVLLEARGGIELLQSAGLTDHEMGTILQSALGVEWTFIEARISLWNVGLGLAVFTYELPPTAWSDLSGLASATRGNVYKMVPEVTCLVRALVGQPTKGSKRHANHASALGGNPIYLVQAAAEVDIESRRVIASAVTADGLDCAAEEYGSSLIRIGRHCSVVADTFTDRAAEVLVRLAGVYQVCWAVSLLYDAKLAAELSRIEPGKSAPTMSELQQQADRTLTEYYLVRLFRLRYSSVEAHLEPAASLIWNALEKGWKFQRVLTVLDDRLDFVLTLHRQLFGRLQDHRARLLNELVTAFTFLNIFAIVLAALTFGTIPKVAQTPIAATVVIVTLVINLVAYSLFRRRVNRHQ